jgi:hypothetical protein
MPRKIIGGGSLLEDLLIFSAIDACAQDVPQCDILFSCETARHKFIRICGKQDETDVDKWSGIQYRHGAEDSTPELVFPKDSSGKPQLFFSHEESEGTIVCPSAFRLAQTITVSSRVQRRERGSR